MKEAEARRLLRRCDDPGGLEAWIVGQPWEAVSGGWRVIPALHGWRFRLETIPGGLRVSTAMPGALPAVWTVTTPRP
jgi:hypothetical protein